MPEDLEALRTTLQNYGFKLRRSEMGVTRYFSAMQDDLYRYQRASGQREFVFLNADTNDLPPRLTAPGLDPEPTLIWYRDNDGKLVQDIVYD